MNNLTIRKKLGLGYGVILLIMLVISTVTYNSLKSMIEITGWVDHTHKVIEVGSKISTSMVNMETGLRGFIITGDENYLDPYFSGNKTFNQLIEKASKLTSDNPTQVERWQEVKSLKAKWINQWGKPQIDKRRDVNNHKLTMNNLIKEMKSTIGKKYMDTIRAKLNVIIEAEKRMLLIRDKQQKDTANFTISFSIIATIVAMIFGIFIALFITKSIQIVIDTLNNGILNLINSKDVTSRVEINSKDEIGEVSKNFNIYLESIENQNKEDNKVIAEAEIVMKRVKHGWYSETIQNSTSNKPLNDFKNNVNDMILAIKENFRLINVRLEEYSNYNYTKKLSMPNIEKGGVFDLLINDINGLREAINNMLMENKQNGLTLDSSSDILLENVDSLNKNANANASALEETAASIEEITSNISNNTKNIIQIATFASNITESSSKGEKLAKKTTEAMNEIDEEVNAINDAILVIDQIAFQTNILSLNAAVEAATAGEAGKGFAVVAQEVRNLAARSADAANEIKTIVQSATTKANDGKKTSDEMINGYSELNDNITKTVNLIKDVEMASKEQLHGIEQINDAVNNIDKQTQEIASVASKTNEIAVQTDTIAKLILSDADKKEFIGKDSVKAKNME